MESIRERLKMLKEMRKQASHSNFKEVLEENERSKRPANWEKKLERNLKKIEKEEEKQKVEEGKQDYEMKKSLDIQANELESWDKSKKRKDVGFVDFETATVRQYRRMVKQHKPDMEEYERLKEEVGEKAFYPDDKDAIPKAALIKDSKEGIERMAKSVERQIEARSKRSRRRRFDDEADVDYINERNMKFNKKLERFYGNYTEEIKQNFERGTAL